MVKKTKLLRASRKGVLRVAAVQFRSGPDPITNATRMALVLADCAKRGVEMAVFPECALTSYVADAIKRATAKVIVDSETELARACRQLGIAAIIGAPEHADDKWFNAAVIISRNGRIKT